MDAEFLHRPLIERCAIETGLTRYRLEIAKLSLRCRLIGSDGGYCHWLLAIAGCTGTRRPSGLDRSVNDATMRGAEFVIRAELSAEPESGQGATNRLGLGLLEVIPKVAGRLAAPTRRRAGARNLHLGAEDRGVVHVRDQLSFHRGVGVPIAQPHQSPLDFEIFRSIHAGQVSSRIERGFRGHVIPPSCRTFVLMGSVVESR